MKTKFTGFRQDIERLARRIARPVKFMEVCGTHTVSAFRAGIRELLPESVRLLSGPGCPVCVTAQRHIDAAIELASRERIMLATYGDMIRVPGRLGSLERLRAAGARIRVVGSARGALHLARENPDTDVVFLAVGFETTAPATAAVIIEAAEAGMENFSILSSHKLVIPAMAALLRAGTALDGFLCPGHVSVIIGSRAYEPIARDHRKPCVVAGFEPGQIMTGLIHLMRQVAEGRAEVENVYPAVVNESGNRAAIELLDQVFRAADTVWRELGEIPQSGLELRTRYGRFDAARRFGLAYGADEDHPACRCGEVIVGRAEPSECALFGRGCTPLTPIGPCMVSGEGTCAAWYKYRGVRAVERSSASTRLVVGGREGTP